MELMLWSEDYVRFSNFLETGMVVCLSGSFSQRFKTSSFEFKLNSVTLLESLMKACTKKVQIEMKPKDVTADFIEFIEKNVNNFPGNTTLKFCINDMTSKLKFGMYSLEKGFEMNDEMAMFLQEKSQLDIQVELT